MNGECLHKLKSKVYEEKAKHVLNVSTKNVEIDLSKYDGIIRIEYEQ